MRFDNEIIEWLLEGDPSVAWQAQRDLLDEPADLYASTQARVTIAGWGAQFLGLQDPEGSWAQGL